LIGEVKRWLGKKRKRGAPMGNQNARKHGFFLVGIAGFPFPSFKGEEPATYLTRGQIRGDRDEGIVP